MTPEAYRTIQRERQVERFIQCMAYAWGSRPSDFALLRHLVDEGRLLGRIARFRQVERRMGTMTLRRYAKRWNEGHAPC